MFKIEIKIKESEIKKYGDDLIKKIDLGLNDLTDYIATKSDAILRGEEIGGAQRPKHPGSFDTGMLAKSLAIFKEKEFEKIIAYEAPHSVYIEFGCFFDKKTEILTSLGRKRISEIQEGDKVLTHNGEWKKVIHLVEYQIETPVTEYIIKIGKRYIRVTEDHPILVRIGNNEVWKIAKDIELNDEIICIKYNGMDLMDVKEKHSEIMKTPEFREKLSSSVKIGHTKIPEDKKIEWRKKIGDANRGKNNGMYGMTGEKNPFFGKHPSKETREKLSKASKGRKAWNKGLTKETHPSLISTSEKNSKYMTEYSKIHPDEMFEKALKMREHSMFFNTKIERKVIQELTKNNINHINQYRIFDEEYREWYCTDHYLPDYNLVIEDYGNYWHNYPEGNDADRLRINRIKSLGYNVLILWENQIYKENFIEEINKCIKNIEK